MFNTENNDIFISISGEIKSRSPSHAVTDLIFVPSQLLHGRDFLFKKAHAVCCERKFNILLPILEYLSHLYSDFQMVFSIVMGIRYAFM